jgi:hypothetical protein
LLVENTCCNVSFTFSIRNPEDVEILKNVVAGTTEETQATLLLKRRKDMRMVDEALEAVKQQFKLRMERLAERQARFEDKQCSMQEMVAKFKPFIEEVG